MTGHSERRGRRRARGRVSPASAVADESLSPPSLPSPRASHRATPSSPSYPPSSPPLRSQQPLAPGQRDLGAQTHAAFVVTPAAFPPAAALQPSTRRRAVEIVSQQLQQINIPGGEERSLEANSPASVCRRFVSAARRRPEGRAGRPRQLLSPRGPLAAGAGTPISHTSPAPWCSLLERRQDALQRPMLGASGRFYDDFFYS